MNLLRSPERLKKEGKKVVLFERDAVNEWISVGAPFDISCEEGEKKV